MKISYGTEICFSGPPAAVTIGAFDGVHSGHKKIVEQTLSVARNTRSIASAVTFEKKYPALTTLDEKLELLRQNGIKKAVVMLSQGDWKNWPADYFVKEFLIRRMKASHAVVGKDFRFGKSREGSIDTLKKAGSPDIETHAVELEKMDGKKVSSSSIRKFLKEGNIRKCSILLGRHYSFTGKIVEGKKLGRKLGFPTVNFSVDEEKMLPEGVFLCRALIEGEKENSYPGACFIRGSGERKVEVHFIDKVPGRIISIKGAELLEKISDIEKFSTHNQLAKKIDYDVRLARKIFEEKSFDTAKGQC